MNVMWPYRTPGIPDAQFVRGDLPMTKKEVRVVSLAQARIRPDAVVIDVGAGTGSFSIEAAFCAQEGRVYAIEKEIEGVNLIKANAAKFGVQNVKVIHGKAPEALAGLPQSDVIFIGGSGGNLSDILTVADRLLRPGGRLVANAIVLENMAEVIDFIKKNKYTDIEITQVSVAKGEIIGQKHMVKGSNPVWIISAERGL